MEILAILEGAVIIILLIILASKSEMGDRIRNSEPYLRLFEVCIISIASIVVAMKANEIAEKEYNLQELISMPDILVNSSYSGEEKAGYHSTATFNVKVPEEYITSVDIEVKTCFEYIDDEGDEYICSKSIISGFYNEPVSSECEEGIQYTYTRENNYGVIDEIYNYIDFMNLEYDDIKIVPKTFIKVSYEDLLGNLQIRYYCEDGIKIREANQDEINEIYLCDTYKIYEMDEMPDDYKVHIFALQYGYDAGNITKKEKETEIKSE